MSSLHDKSMEEMEKIFFEKLSKSDFCLSVKVSQASVIRLSKYRNILYRFKSVGINRVLSSHLSEAAGVSAAQVRKDFSIFGITGNKRGGYKIDDILDSINKILGKNKVEKVVIAGAGKLGQAVMNYGGFKEEGIVVEAGFDIDPAQCGTGRKVPIYPLEQMKEFIRQNNIKVGIIAVPDIAASLVLEQMISAGIKGIVNFAPIELKVPDDVVVKNVNIAHELENVIYFVNLMEKLGR